MDAQWYARVQPIQSPMGGSRPMTPATPYYTGAAASAAAAAGLNPDGTARSQSAGGPVPGPPPSTASSSDVGPRSTPHTGSAIAPPPDSSMHTGAGTHDPEQQLPDSTPIAQQADDGTSATSLTEAAEGAVLGGPHVAPANEMAEFDPEDLRGRYRMIRYLGRGAYGHVAQGERVRDKRKVAIKKICGVFANSTDAKRILRELRILRMLHAAADPGHDTIVAILDVLPPKNLDNFVNLYVVFEYVDTDLHGLLETDQHFSVLHIQYMIYQILVALKWLHSCNVVHRDLKPANILVNANCSLKLCDFGLARGLSQPSVERVQSMMKHIAESQPSPGLHMTPIKRQLTAHVVTRWYRAPEVILLEKQYGFAVDMWSVGCILAELFNMLKANSATVADRAPLFPGATSYPFSGTRQSWAEESDQLNTIFSVTGSPTPADIDAIRSQDAKTFLSRLPQKRPIDLQQRFPGTPPEGIDLLAKLLVFNPEHRLTVYEALEHPFLKPVRVPKVERAHRPLSFEFEDVALDSVSIRKLLVDEVLYFNPDLAKRFPDRRASRLFLSGTESPPGSPRSRSAAGATQLPADAATSVTSSSTQPEASGTEPAPSAASPAASNG